MIMKKILAVLLVLLVFENNSSATHLMGGEITWQCIKTGPDAGKYIFNVMVYRDCQGVSIDTMMSLDAHNVPGVSSIPLIYIGGSDISPSCNTIDGPNTPFSCGALNSGAANGNGAVEEHFYQSAPIEINGTPDANGWHFTWSLCCRNNAVTNIMNPGSYGFTLRAVMYSYTDSLGNVFPSGGACYDSSPKFYEKPRTILEVGNGYDPLAFSNGFTYSHNAFDEEQDSIAYTWGEPLNDLGYDYLNPNSTAVPFMSPYTFTMPINGIVLNPITGRTYYPANLQGNYVTCTNVSAYKCGQLVSEIFREVQIVLVPPTCNLGDTTNGNFGADTLCNVRPVVQPPFFYPGTSAPFQWDTVVHCGDTVAFDFIANDNDYYPNGSKQDLKFEVSGGQFYNYNAGVPCQNPPCATFEETSTGATPPFITSGGTGAGYFEWITSCNHVINSCSGGLEPSIYTFVIKVQDDFCPAPAIENTSQVISITVYPPCGSLKANEVVIPESSCGVGDGSISVNPSGGFAPYVSYFFDMNGIPVNPNTLPSGDYQLRITDISLCETIDTVTVVGPVPVSVNNNQTICNGDSIIVGSNIYFTSGSYTDILTSINGCDSTINTTLIVNMSNTSSTSVITCDSSYLWNGVHYTSSGTYNNISPNSTGCDSIATLILVINSTSSTTSLVTECNSYIWDGVTYSISGTYTNIYTNTLGCDSIHYLNLTINNSSNIINNQTLCSGSSYSINGNTYSTSGTYIDTLISSNGCDSIVTTNLYISNAINIISNSSPVSCNGYTDGSINVTASGGSLPYTYLWSNGVTTQSISNVAAGTYNLNIYDANNCIAIDSIIVTEPSALQTSISSSNGVITGNVLGGSSPYNYEFFGPNGLIVSSSNNLGNSLSITPINSGNYSFIVLDANGCSDSASIYFSLNFSPTVTVSLSNTYCDSLADLTIEVSQDSGEVDMSTAIFQSTAGEFNIAAMSVGDTIGTAYLMAGGGSIMVNTYLMVSSVINVNQAIICANDSVLGCLGGFTINNNPGSGIYILTNTIPDSNNYTSGNMSSITFVNCFINPCGFFSFNSTINSELGDTYNQSTSFGTTYLDDFSKFNVIIHPNPSNGKITLEMNEVNRDRYNVTINNLLGQKVYYINKDIVGLFRHDIDISKYGKGTYLITITNSSEKLITEKLIVE